MKKKRKCFSKNKFMRKKIYRFLTFYLLFVIAIVSCIVFVLIIRKISIYYVKQDKRKRHFIGSHVCKSYAKSFNFKLIILV